MIPAQQGNDFFPRKEAAAQRTAPALDPRNASKDPGCGNEAVEISKIVPLQEKQPASKSHDPVNDKPIRRITDEGSDIPGAQLCRGAWRNSDDIGIFYERTHAAASRPEADG